MMQEKCNKHPRYWTYPFCPDCQHEIEHQRQAAADLKIMFVALAVMFLIIGFFYG